MTARNNAPKMRGIRGRNQDGQLRNKRNDTHMGTIEKQYNREFGVRSDMELGTFLEEKGFNSLAELMESDLGKKG
ncbi:MAG: hypothetical protein ABIR31_05195 [Ginsengibacter sp.]